jgi:hypothetical protein
MIEITLKGISIDKRLAVWRNFLAALDAKRKEFAKTLLSERSSNDYDVLLDQLISQTGPVSAGQIDGWVLTASSVDSADFLVARDDGAGRRTLHSIRVIRDAEGKWRLDSFSWHLV